MSDKHSTYIARFIEQVRQTPLDQACFRFTEVHAITELALDAIQTSLANPPAHETLTSIELELNEIESLLASTSQLLEKSAENTRLLRQIEKDFTTWQTILQGRVSSLPTKQQILDAVTALPEQVRTGISKMASPRLIVIVPEPIDKTIEDLNINRFSGQYALYNNLERTFREDELSTLAPAQLVFEIADAHPDPKMSLQQEHFFFEKEFDKHMALFSDYKLKMLGIYGYLGIWRLYQEDKKQNPQLPLLDRTKGTYFYSEFSDDINKKLNNDIFDYSRKLMGGWSNSEESIYLRRDSNTPTCNEANYPRFRSSVVIFRYQQPPADLGRFIIQNKI